METGVYPCTQRININSCFTRRCAHGRRRYCLIELLKKKRSYEQRRLHLRNQENVYEENTRFLRYGFQSVRDLKQRERGRRRGRRNL